LLAAATASMPLVAARAEFERGCQEFFHVESGPRSDFRELLGRLSWRSLNLTAGASSPRMISLRQAQTAQYKARSVHPTAFSAFFPRNSPEHNRRALAFILKKIDPDDFYFLRADRARLADLAGPEGTDVELDKELRLDEADGPLADSVRQALEALERCAALVAQPEQIAADVLRRANALPVGVNGANASADWQPPASQAEQVERFLDNLARSVAFFSRRGDSPETSLEQAVSFTQRQLARTRLLLSPQYRPTLLLKAWTQALDPYSYFLTLDELDDSKNEKCGYSGIGTALLNTDNGLQIVGLCPNGPAEKAGLRPGDELIAVDGFNVRNFDEIDVSKLVRGRRGSAIAIRVRRDDGRDYDFSLMREEITEMPSTEASAEASPVKTTLRPLRSGRHEASPRQIARIRLSSFSPGIARKIRAELKRVGPSASGLLFDLRDNPGGRFHEVIKAVEAVVPPGLPLLRAPNLDTAAYDSPDNNVPVFNGPIVVLVNGRTASAGEILAGALQALGRAIVVGAPTRGKGSIHDAFDLPGIGRINLTLSLYYFADGHSPQGLGVNPDIPIATAANNVPREADHPAAFAPSSIERSIYPFPLMPWRPALLRALRENAAARAGEAEHGARSAQAIDGAAGDPELAAALDIFADYLDFLGRPAWYRRFF
jgi:carboxyl-terminal processing protease